MCLCIIVLLDSCIQLTMAANAGTTTQTANHESRVDDDGNAVLIPVRHFESYFSNKMKEHKADQQAALVEKDVGYFTC
jgi:hypothetical protein